MNILPTPIADVVQIIPTRHGDERGFFSETFREDWFDKHVGPVRFVQENMSLSRPVGVVRGLHFQSEPAAQGKLVRCLAGAIFDVAVDVRHGSPDYLKWTAVTLTAEQGNQLWVPPGFLHGFCTLVPDCLVAYKVDAYYSAANDKGVRWDDPDIGVAWPDIADPAHLSPKDSKQPLARDIPAYFTYGAGF